MKQQFYNLSFKMIAHMAIGLVCLVTLPEAGAQGEAPGEVQLQSVNYRGSGCPQNSVGVYLSDDAQAFTLIFDEYNVDIDQDVQRTLAIKRCDLDIQIQVPNGWRFQLFSFDVRGYAALDKDIGGFQRAAYKLGAAPTRILPTLSMSGPYYDNFERAGRIALNSSSWSSCSRREVIPVKLFTSITLGQRLRNRIRGNSQGLMTVDTIDGELKHRYGIAWERCGSLSSRFSPRWRR